MKLHPQVIEKEGKNEFVVLPIDEYQALTDLVQDYEDLRDLREAKDAKGVPLEKAITDLEI